MSLSTPVETALRDRILRAAVRCIARWGVSKSSLEDIAREAACSRASVYRAFPGGKESLLQEVVTSEITTFFDAVDFRLASATSLDEMLRAGVSEALIRLRGHEALAFLAEYEPDRLLLSPSFTGIGRILPPSVAFTSAHLRRFLAEDVADEAAEWVVRVVLSYAMAPPIASPRTENDSDRLVEVLLVPAISALSGLVGASATTP